MLIVISSELEVFDALSELDSRFFFFFSNFGTLSVFFKESLFSEDAGYVSIALAKGLVAILDLSSIVLSCHSSGMSA